MKKITVTIGTILAIVSTTWLINASFTPIHSSSKMIVDRRPQPGKPVDDRGKSKHRVRESKAIDRAVASDRHFASIHTASSVNATD